MKIRGKAVVPPKPITVTIYRVDSEGKPCDFEFVCGAILNYNEFETLLPQPKPPLIMKPGQPSVPDNNDPRYLKKVDEWSNRRVAYMTLQSLNHTPDLEWETVVLTQPDTWNNYEKELKSWLTEAEYNRLIMGVYEANSPSEKRRNEALENFTPTPVEATPE
jgi:hypothetical protein